MGADEGIDLRHCNRSGRVTIVQCKHYAGSDFPRLLSHLRRRELPQVERLRPARYVVATSISLTPANKCRIIDLLGPYVRHSRDVLGCDDLNGLLSRHPEVQRRHIKLWLTSVELFDRAMRHARLCQSEFEVQRIHARSHLYVPNQCFKRARAILQRNRVVIIAGKPGIGKTTLAEMLLYSYIGRGYTPVVLRSSIEEGQGQFEHRVRQIFYFDDFLGRTFLGENRHFLGRNEDLALLRFIERVSCSVNSLLIMTSREHVVRDACRSSERLNQGFISDLKCVLQLGDYSLSQKARILYNHVYFSDLPAAYRRQFKRPHLYLTVLRSEYFSPRYVEWICSFARVRHVSARAYERFVLTALKCPERIWKHAFEQEIGDAGRSVLLALATLEDSTCVNRVLAATEGLHQHRTRKYGMTWAPDDIRNALRDLEGTFMNLACGRVAFLNPSVGEFVKGTVWGSSDHLADVIAGAVYFEQLRRTWEGACHAKVDPGLLHASLLRALDVALYSPSPELAERTSWGWRLKFVLEIMESVGRMGLDEHIERLSVRLAQSGGSDARCLLDILELVDRLGCHTETLGGSVMDLLFAELEFAALEQFVDVDEYRTNSPRWTTADTSRYMQAFERYLRERLDFDRTVDDDDLTSLARLLDWIQMCPEPVDSSARAAVARLERAVGRAAHRSNHRDIEYSEAYDSSVLALMEALRESLQGGRRRVTDPSARVRRLFRSI